MRPTRAAALVSVLAMLSASLTIAASAAVEPCAYWVSTGGSDAADGSKNAPWATLTHAVETVPDANCTITVKRGVYREAIEIERRFTTEVRIRAAKPYRAVFEYDSDVLDIDGARGIVVARMVFRHDGPGATGHVVNVDNGSGIWAERITFRDNVFHDSYDNDLLKIHAGVKHAIVTGNAFYNQGPGEQHMDVNSVTDVKIQNNVFFNDFASSGRNDGDAKHFIVVKDSGVFDDGLQGSERITIRRNVFMNWEGDVESFIQIGNAGDSYHEAEDVRVESNLFLGNSRRTSLTPLGVSGARNVWFVNNTVVGDLPTKAYGFRVNVKGDNPLNENLTIANNIWSDATGSMDDFTSGEASSVRGLVFDNNLYWNGGARLPDGDVVDPRDDAHRVVADPQLATNHNAVTLPIWSGTEFPSGEVTIRAEFERIVRRYASIPLSSPAVDRSDPSLAPGTDILRRPRSGTADLGAFEAGEREVRCMGVPATEVGSPGPDTIVGTPGRDVIVGLGGDDVIYGLGGGDLICGWGGNDTIYGGPGADEIRGGKGRDRVHGSNGSDHLTGDGGVDYIFGGEGADVIYGKAGDDRLYGNEDDDVLDGGRGVDVAAGGKGYDTCNAEDAICEATIP
jgi:Ca2+-binding RTX toxin-like protein